MQKYVC